MFVPDMVLGPALCLSRKSWTKQVAVLVCVIVKAQTHLAISTVTLPKWFAY